MEQSVKDIIILFKKIVTMTLQVVFISGFIFSAVMLWFWLSDADNFPIRKIKVYASFEHITKNEFQNAISPFISSGFLSFDVLKLKNDLEQLTWVDAVTVQKIWPDTLIVKATEQRAVAKWGKGGLLNSEGVLFYPRVETIPQDLPILMGPNEQNQSIYQHYLVLKNLLDEINMKIVDVQVSPRRSWQIRFDNNIALILGHENHIERVKRFIKLWPRLKEKSKKPIHQVDLRYPNGLAVS